MVNLGLSGDKAIFFYDDRVDYYQIDGLSTWLNSPVKLIFSKIITGSTSADGQYKFVFTCVCGEIQKSSCYSSTLNCFIVKKAGIACGVRNIPVYQGD